MWEINIGVEAQSLVWSVILGAAASLLYDVLRAVNKIFKPNAVFVFIFDLLYWIFLTLVFFIYFMAFTNGQVRMFAFFGATAGFLIYLLTLSKIFLFLFCKIIFVLRLFFDKIKLFLMGVAAVFEKILVFLKKTLKKAFLKLKKS